MTALVAAAGALAMVFLATRDQRNLWWTMRARWYRDPQANEPSDAAFAMQRVGWVFLAVVLAIGAFLLFDVAQDTSLSGSEVRDAAEQAASSLSSDEDGVLVDNTSFQTFESYVDDAVRHSGTAEDNISMLSVSRADGEEDTKLPSAGRAGDEVVERYVISNDDEAVCMTVTGTNAGEYTTPYTNPVEGMPVAYEYMLSASVEDGYCS